MEEAQAEKATNLAEFNDNMYERERVNIYSSVLSLYCTLSFSKGTSLESIDFCCELQQQQLITLTSVQRQWK